MFPNTVTLTKGDVDHLIASEAYRKSNHPDHKATHALVKNWFAQLYNKEEKLPPKEAKSFAFNPKQPWQHLGDTLLVSEGNMSFTKAISNMSSLGAKNITSTTFESERNLTDEGKANAEQLRKAAITVLHNVDATRLDYSLRSEKFDTIIFQFPNVGNREAKYGRNPNYIMIRKFLQSAAQFLKPGGKILISAVDSPHYQGAFQFEEAAEYACYEQPVSSPFDPSMFPGYSHTNTNDGNSALDDHGEFLTWVFQPQT